MRRLGLSIGDEQARGEIDARQINIRCSKNVNWKLTKYLLLSSTMLIDGSPDGSVAEATKSDGRFDASPLQKMTARQTDELRILLRRNTDERVRCCVLRSQ